MGEKYHYHNPLPDECETVERLYDCLCSLAVHTGRNDRVIDVYPDFCATCAIGCAYGRRLVEILNETPNLPKIKRTTLA